MRTVNEKPFRTIEIVTSDLSLASGAQNRAANKEQFLQIEWRRLGKYQLRLITFMLQIQKITLVLKVPRFLIISSEKLGCFPLSHLNLTPNLTSISLLAEASTVCKAPIFQTLFPPSAYIFFIYNG